jgi:glycosyltransferase involved in cell wall biosynthesis
MWNTSEPHASRTRRGAPKIAVVVSGWPRVSEVFAQNELLALQRAGMLAGVFATKEGEAGPRQPGIDHLDGDVEQLPDGDVAQQGAALAGRLAGRGVSAVHGYFAHQPAAVAAEAARLLGVPYGFSVHALDARKVARTELAERAAGAAVVVCCNEDVAADVEAAGVRPRRLRHGVDLDQFPYRPAPDNDPLSLLAVGRLVEKKGFDVLIEAMSLLDRPCRLRLVGTGPLEASLRTAIADRGLEDRVELLGRRTHRQLPELYAAADAVVVPSVVDSSGDRDGLPNVVLEAMASGRAVVASDVASIPSAVVDGSTGLLVPPRDPKMLAQALATLVDSPRLRHAMGRAGRDRTERAFALEHCTAAFCRTLEQVYG